MAWYNPISWGKPDIGGSIWKATGIPKAVKRVKDDPEILLVPLGITALTITTLFTLREAGTQLGAELGKELIQIIKEELKGDEEDGNNSARSSSKFFRPASKNVHGPD